MYLHRDMQRLNELNFKYQIPFIVHREKLSSLRNYTFRYILLIVILNA